MPWSGFLLRDGQPITLPPKDLETLLVLVERAGHIVEKEELLEKVWPGVFVEENNLARHIFNLRQVLGDSPDGRKYIETIPKRGYRFVASVYEGSEPAAPHPSTSQASDQAHSSAGVGQKRSLWLWPLALIAALAVTAVLVSRYFWPPRNPSRQRVMLAVLPFANLSGDAHEDYFADGLTEEMIASSASCSRRSSALSRELQPYDTKTPRRPPLKLAGNWAWAICSRERSARRGACAGHCTADPDSRTDSSLGRNLRAAAYGCLEHSTGNRQKRSRILFPSNCCHLQQTSRPAPMSISRATTSTCWACMKLGKGTRESGTKRFSTFKKA